MSTLSDAIAAASDLLARGEALAADITKFDIGAVVGALEADAKAVVADLPALKAEAESVMSGVNAKLSAIGMGLHALGLASAGPNVESSQEMAGFGDNAP